jgi:hypothetical protein
MAKRLYNIGLDHEIDWPKTERINSNSFPLNLQNMELDDHRLEQQFRATRHSSSPTLMLSRQSIFRNGHNSLPGLSLHIQSMKKSAFKMLCKLNTSHKRKG